MEAAAEGAREGTREAGQEIEPLNSSDPREPTGGVVGMELMEYVGRSIAVARV